MEITWLYFYISALLITFLTCKFLSSSLAKTHNLPPSPFPSLPVLGHLHLLKQPLHRTLHRLSLKHGPIFSLRLGSRLVVVVSSADLAEECFTKNDIVFANRPRVLVDKYIGYNHTTMAGAPYGEQWRQLRRVGAQEVLSPSRLNAFVSIRQDETNRFLKSLQEISPYSIVKLRPKLWELVFNIIMRMVAGKRYFNEGNEDSKGNEFRGLISEVFEHASTSNPEDFLPFLLWIDYRGLKKNMAALGKKMDEFYQGLLDDHRRDEMKRDDTMIGHLISLQESQPEFYTDQAIKGLTTNIVIAGTETSVVSLEWAMSLLLNHPNILQKAKDELDARVGLDRLVQERDLPNLPYLHNIILETFRLFPAGPLLMPHESSVDCKIGKYDVPCGSILLVNSWAIHRDPNIWEDPTSFKPERFEGREVEAHQLMPFGAGRRACPGSNLGQRMVGLALGSMLQCFEWERVTAEEVDLSEGIGLTMPKLKPLEARCKPRGIMLNALKESGIINII